MSANAEPAPAGEPAPSAPPAELVRTTRLELGDVLRGVDLVVRAGTTALAGPLGSGKTTLLRALLGLEPGLGGEARVLGFDPVREGVSIRAAVGYVPPRLGFPAGMSAHSLERFVRELYPGWSSRRFFQIAARRKLPVRERLERLPRAAQAQVALSVALAQRPRLLLVDPPADLDPLGREQLLSALVAERGDLPLVVATEHPGELAGLADDVVFLAQGRVVHSGRRRALPDAPGALEEAYRTFVRPLE